MDEGEKMGIWATRFHTFVLDPRGSRLMLVVSCVLTVRFPNTESQEMFGPPKNIPKRPSEVFGRLGIHY